MSDEQQVGVAPAEPVPLWRNRRFQLLWTGSAFSMLGLEISLLVYPLAVLAVTGSPALAGVFGGVHMAAGMVASLPAGELCDRYDRRRLLLFAETLRVVVTGSVVAALVLAELTLVHLVVAALLLGAVQPLGGSARMLMVRAVVPGEQLTTALTQEEVRSHAASMGGPPLGGFLYGTAMVLPFVFNAVTFTLSFLCVLFVRPTPPQPRPADQGESSWQRMLSGMRATMAKPELRGVLLFTVLMNVASAPFGLISVVVLEEQGVSSGVIGLAMAGMAVGGLAGTFLVKPIHRLEPGRVMGAMGITTAVLVGLLGLPLGPWWVAGVLFLLLLGVPAMRILVDLLIFRQVPDELRGRVITAAMTMYGVGSALGMTGGGLLLEYLPSPWAAAGLAALVGGCTLFALTMRGFRGLRWPESGSADTVEQR